ncbi:hypothetical protein BC937DRAFT_93682 [Endogone sp. FLAS-F59071]|nr:hypothetical protein BC937DRAFT_93682 [Endogone sp. FLAS-F59071]|eukprot:RUS14524.1 hypothetical protein BC937DRAFT_93682 [Endogone sp. FLAS-F59071]
MMTSGHAKTPSVSSINSESSSRSGLSNKSKEGEEPNFPAHIVDELSPNFTSRDVVVEPQFPDHLYLSLPSPDRLVTSSSGNLRNVESISNGKGSSKDLGNDFASLSMAEDDDLTFSVIGLQRFMDNSQQGTRTQIIEGVTSVPRSVGPEISNEISGVAGGGTIQNGKRVMDENPYEGDRSDEDSDKWAEFHPPQGVSADAVTPKPPSVKSSKNRESSRSKNSLEIKESSSYPMRLPSEVTQKFKQEEEVSASIKNLNSRPPPSGPILDVQEFSPRPNFNFDISTSTSRVANRLSVSSFDDTTPAPAYPNFLHRLSTEFGRRAFEHSDNESRHSVSSDYKGSSLRDSISSGFSQSSLASAELAIPSPGQSMDHERTPPPRFPEEIERRWSSSSSVGEGMSSCYSYGDPIDSRAHTAELEETHARNPFPPKFPRRNSLISALPAYIPSVATKTEARPSGSTDPPETRNRRNSASSRSIMSVLSHATSGSSKTFSSFSDDEKETRSQAEKLRKASLSLIKSTSEVTSSSSPLRKHISKLSVSSSNGSSSSSDSRDMSFFHPSKGPFTVARLDSFASASGWLSKYSAPTFGFATKSWKKRYFLLVDTIFFSFKSEDAATLNNEYFELIPETIVFVTDDHDPRLYVIKVMRPDNRIWYVQAETESGLKMWLTELKKVVARLRSGSPSSRISTESAAFGTTSALSYSSSTTPSLTATMTESSFSGSLPSTPRRSITSLQPILSNTSTNIMSHNGETSPATSPPSSPRPSQYGSSVHQAHFPILPSKPPFDSTALALSLSAELNSYHTPHDSVTEMLLSKRPLSPTKNPPGSRRRASHYKTLSRVLPPQLPPPVAALPAPPNPNFDGGDLPPPARPPPQIPLPPIPGSPSLPSPGGTSVSSPASSTPTQSALSSPRPSSHVDGEMFRSPAAVLLDDQHSQTDDDEDYNIPSWSVPMAATAEMLRRTSSTKKTQFSKKAADNVYTSSATNEEVYDKSTET